MRALARLAAASLVLVVACTTDRLPTGVAGSPAAAAEAIPEAAVAADASVAAALADPVLIGHVNVQNDTLLDPDVGVPGQDDGVCDDLPGLAVGSRCTLRDAIKNHNRKPEVPHKITFGVDSVRLSRDAFMVIDGTLIIDGTRADGRKTVLQGPWVDTTSGSPALQMNVCNSRIAGLAIADFPGGGIYLLTGSRCAGVGGNVIEDNWVGIRRNGRPAGPSDAGRVGIHLGSSGNVVRRNVIGGHGYGVLVFSSFGPTGDGNQLIGNVIGLTPDARDPFPNAVGVSVRRGPYGGPIRRLVVDGNAIVSKPDGHAVSLFDADSSRIERNRIGLDALGRVYPNAAGIVIASSLTALQRHAVRSNEVAGSLGAGITLIESADNDVSLNVVTGAGGNGILVTRSQVTPTGSRTLVSVNRVERSRGAGILMGTTGGDSVRGNTLRANAGAGLNARSAQGLTVIANPTIEGNAGGGIVLGSSSRASGNSIAANAGAGVLVTGKDNAVTDNTITANQGAGVAVESPTVAGATSRNAIRANRIWGNGVIAGLGIDLGPLGVTPNDPGDADAGANGLQNFPVLTAATTVTVTGTLASTPATTFKLDFYSSTACNRFGHGEGQLHLDSATVTTGADGTAAVFAVLARLATAGSYVTATATDPAGSTSEFSACRAVVVAPPGPPVASAGGPYAGAEGTPIAFSGARSYDPAGEPITYAWSFGDGTTSTVANPTKTYAANGTYTVTLTVRDPGGLTSAATTTATVANVAPTVDLQPPAPPLAVGASLAFPHVVSDPGGAGDAPWTVTIAWGDGRTDTRTTSSIIGGPVCPAFCESHVYAAPGTYTVTMTVRDKDGGVGSDAVTITVLIINRPPVVVVGGPYTGAEGTPIAFRSTGTTDPEGGALTYLWTFGDGTTSTLPNPTKSYANDGVYTVTLAATDTAGLRQTATTTATIADAPPAVTLRATTATTVMAGSTVWVEGSFTDPGTNDGPWQVLFQWNDGPTSAPPAIAPIRAGRTLAQPGTYSVTMRVTDRNGVSGVSAPVTFTVTANPWVGWQGLGGGSLTSAPVVFKSSSRRDVFARSADGTLWHRYSIDNGWSAWQSLGSVASNPAVASWTPGQLDIFVRGTDGALWHRAYVAGGWAAWESLGGSLLGTPAAVSWGAGRLDVFVRGVDNVLYHLGWQLGYGWSQWESQDGGVRISADPVVVSWGVGRLDVFVRGIDNALWHKCFENGWSGWTGLGGGLAGAPAAATWGPGRLDVFVRGTDNALWHMGWQNGYGWSAWEPQGGALTSEPAVVASGPGRLEVFIRGTDAALYHKWFNVNWSGWVSRGGSLASGPAVTSPGVGWADVYVLGTDGAIWQRYTTP